MYEKLFPQNSKRRQWAKKMYQTICGKYSEEERIYQKWILENEPTKKQLEEQRNTKFAIEPKISIVVPVYNTPEEFFKELVQSLQNQTYANWELCLADGSPEPISYMQEYPKKDKRIRYKIIGKNKGISGNTNEALTLATGDFIGLLDHDDLLPTFSLYEVVKTINEHPEVEFIYSDEDKLETAKGPRYGVFFKPDFSPYTLNSANYICHFSLFKKELMDQLQGFSTSYDGSQDFDIVARASELTSNIIHIPKVLYHWRAHRNSTASNSDSKPYAFEVGKKVIHDHVQRSLGIEVEVTDGLTPGSYEVRYPVKGTPMVSIILDLVGLSKEDAEILIKKIKQSEYPFYELIAISEIQNLIGIEKTIVPGDKTFVNYNQAVSIAQGDYFIILDHYLEKIDKNTFLEDLVGICQDETVGIVGTKLYNQEETVEHAGIILGMNGVGDFLYQGAPKNIGTYMQRLLIIHNVSCVYTPYAMINKEIFKQVGGFDPQLAGRVASIDFCLKILQMNKQVVLNPIIAFQVTKLKEKDVDEKQAQVLQEKWKTTYEQGDRYFSPNLSKKNTGLSLKIGEN